MIIDSNGFLIMNNLNFLSTPPECGQAALDLSLESAVNASSGLIVDSKDLWSDIETCNALRQLACESTISPEALQSIQLATEAIATRWDIVGSELSTENFTNELATEGLGKVIKKLFGKVLNWLDEAERINRLKANSLSNLGTNIIDQLHKLRIEFRKGAFDSIVDDIIENPAWGKKITLVGDTDHKENHKYLVTYISKFEYLVETADFYHQIKTKEYVKQNYDPFDKLRFESRNNIPKNITNAIKKALPKDAGHVTWFGNFGDSYTVLYIKPHDELIIPAIVVIENDKYEPSNLSVIPVKEFNNVISDVISIAEELEASIKHADRLEEFLDTIRNNITGIKKLIDEGSDEKELKIKIEFYKESMTYFMEFFNTWGKSITNYVEGNLEHLKESFSRYK